MFFSGFSIQKFVVVLKRSNLVYVNAIYSIERVKNARTVLLVILEEYAVLL